MVSLTYRSNPFEDPFFHELAILAEKNNYIDPELHKKYNTKRGLRNSDGTGVLIGLTEIGDVHGYIKENDQKIPQEGKLLYRGIDVKEIVEGIQREKRFGFEEVCYLLLFGSLPNEEQLSTFKEMLCTLRHLPNGFRETMILKAPSKNVMNKLARSVLTSYSYDDNPDDTSIKNVLRQSIELIARFPLMIAYGYQAKIHYYDNQSLVIHLPKDELSTSECFLYMIRPDHHYSELEAETLDLSLILHAEHGGGNNSAFTTHVVSSADTDTYSAISAAIGSLKGSKHGGANIKVIEMVEDLKANLRDWTDENQVEEYLTKVTMKEAYDRTGLIYGMGHAVYTLSDPRSVLLKEKAEKLAKEKNMSDEFHLYALIEKLTPVVLSKKYNKEVIIPANVDLYSGFVYEMLNIPKDLYTPIFAMARIPGWCAHRVEEIVSGGKIIRPAYKSVQTSSDYIPLYARS
ncbi:MAG: citrate/2-methylcitrate synthase [Clostridia bacterium]|nr:citrate/2-methylcitrate synthase [Clostridia bacterium]